MQDLIYFIKFITSEPEYFFGTVILFSVFAHGIYKILLGIRGIPEVKSEDTWDD